MKNRNLLFVFFANILTLGIYSIYWYSVTTDEMNDAGANIPSSWWLFVPLVNIWWLWKYSKGVEHVTAPPSAKKIASSNEPTSALAIFLIQIFLNRLFIDLPLLQHYYNKVDSSKKLNYSNRNGYIKILALIGVLGVFVLGSVTDIFSSISLKYVTYVLIAAVLIFSILTVLYKSKKSRVTKSNVRKSSIELWTLWLAVVATVLLVAVGLFWYISDYNEPARLNERRFWSAIENSLSTPSVVKTTTQGASGKLDTNQQRIFLSGDRLIQTAYTTEVNNPAQSFELSIRTEALQYFGGENFIRYTDYESSEGNNLGEYLGVWSSQNTDDISLEAYKEQYVSGLVSVVMLANLGANDRSEIINNLRDNEIYRINPRDILTSEVDGEETIQVPVVISLRDYIDALNMVFERSGYPDIGLDSESAGEGTLTASIEIRTRDSTITKVSYGTISEEYSNYGVVERPEKPEVNLSYQELQQAVQQILAPENN